jgi:hypothetical protein
MLEPHRKKIAKDPREPGSDSEDGDKGASQLNPLPHDFGTSGGEFGATFDAGLEVSFIIFLDHHLSEDN